MRPVQKMGGQCLYGPKGITEAWQPVDAGHLGATIKSLAKEFLEVWMHQVYKGDIKFEDITTKNFQVWELGKLTMREKRILMTWIFGNAWQKMCSASYQNLMRAAFEKTGILLTSSGKNQNIITSEALQDA